METTSLLALIGAVLCTSIAQILFRTYFLRQFWPWVVGAVGMFVLVPPLNYIALRELPLSTVYMATGMTYVLVVILARVALRETIRRQTVVAMTLIVSGTVLFNIQGV